MDPVYHTSVSATPRNASADSEAAVLSRASTGSLKQRALKVSYVTATSAAGVDKGAPS